MVQQRKAELADTDGWTHIAAAGVDTDDDGTARGLHDNIAPNLLNMMLEQAKHEVFTEEEIVDESVMFYLVPCSPRAWQRAHQRRRERRRRQTAW